MAPLYSGMAKWVTENANYPVKVAMTNAEPVSIAGEVLTKMGVCDTSAWENVWLSHDSVKMALTGDKKAGNYFEQHGLFRPFSLVDTGLLAAYWHDCLDVPAEDAILESFPKKVGKVVGFTKQNGIYVPQMGTVGARERVAHDAFVRGLRDGVYATGKTDVPFVYSKDVRKTILRCYQQVKD